MQNLERKQYTQSELSSEIKNIFTYYDNYRKQYEEKAIDRYKAFIGFVDPKKLEEDRSTLHIPKTYQILDTIRARYLSSFFNKRPYIEFKPMPTAGDIRNIMTNEDKAKVAASFVDEQLEKNNIKSTMFDFVTSMLIFPAAFLSIGWRYEETDIKQKTKVPVRDQYGSFTGQWAWDIVESTEVTWDDNEVNNVDFFDFWGDPDNTTIKDARGVFHREWSTVEDTKKQLDLLARVGDGIVYDVDLDKIANDKSYLDKGRYKRLSAVGITNSGHDPFSDNNIGMGNKRELELLHYWENDRHIIYVNRSEAIYDGANPYWRHRSKPFVKASYDQLPNEFYGLSAAQIIEHLQEEINTLHNQKMDNVSFSINNMWKRLRGSDIDDADLVSKPNGVVDVDDMESLKLLEKGGIPQSVFMSENFLNMNIIEALGTPANVRGVESEGEQTATEASITAQAAQTRFGVKIEIFKEIVIKEMARKMDLNNQQFICDRRAARIDPEDRNSWQAFDPDYLIGEFDYSPAVSATDKAANKELRREQLTEMLGFLMNAQIPFVNYKLLIEDWLEEFDVTNAKKYMIPEEQYEMIRRQVLESLTPQEGVPSEGKVSTNKANTGHLGAGQVQQPRRVSGGMSSTGQPQPQPGQRGGR